MDGWTGGRMEDCKLMCFCKLLGVDCTRQGGEGKTLLKVERLKERRAVGNNCTLSGPRRTVLHLLSLSLAVLTGKKKGKKKRQRAYGSHAFIPLAFSPTFVSDYHSEIKGI